MSITSTFVGRSVMGNECMTWGTYADDGAATAVGDINTKLHLCTRMHLQPGGDTVKTDAAVVNETLPVAGSAVSIVSCVSETGMWYAWGDMFI